MSRKTHSPLSPLLLKLERASGLDRAEQVVLEPLLKAISDRPGILHALQGRAAGHAVHPVLVQIPLGTWTSAALLDLTGTDRAGTPSQVLTSVGLAAALPAILTGLAEAAPTRQADKRVALIHFSSNVVGAGLQVAAMLERAKGHRAGATACSLASMSVLSVAGYLGGHLSVSRGIGSHDPVFDEQPAGAGPVASAGNSSDDHHQSRVSGGVEEHTMSEGQVSETAKMVPGQGADGIPGTDDGVPPAADAQHMPHGKPVDYTDQREHRPEIHTDEDLRPESRDPERRF